MASFKPRRSWWLVVPAGVLAFWPLLATNRLYDPDEFEHLHAAWSVAHGQLPYRDFFEHHGPLTYYLLAPFVRLLGDTPDLLTVHRALALGWILIAVAGIGTILGWRSSGKLGIGLAWLFSFPWFLEKAVEGRPDVPAAALMAWSAWMTRRSALTSSYGWAVVAGATMGIASLFTQKVVFLAAGLALGGAVTSGARFRSSSTFLAAGIVGFALPWVAAAGCFFGAGGLEAFLQRTLVTPFTWPRHVKNNDEYLWNRLSNVIHWAPGHLAILTTALAFGFSRMWNRKRLQRGEFVLWCGLLGHLAGVFFVPAYLQYHLLGAPIAAAWVATVLPLGLRRNPKCLAGMLLLVFAALALPRREELAKLAFYPYSALDAAAACSASVVAIALILFARRSNQLRTCLQTLLLAAAFAPGVGRYLIYHRYWAAGERQRDDLRAFARIAPGPVLDGFTGLGCLRPHASYWWWINHHSLPLMRREGALQDVVEIVRNRRPSVVIPDDGVEHVGGGIIHLLREGYDLKYFPENAHPRNQRPIFVRRD